MGGGGAVTLSPRYGLGGAWLGVFRPWGIKTGSLAWVACEIAVAHSRGGAENGRCNGSFFTPAAWFVGRVVMDSHYFCIG